MTEKNLLYKLKTAKARRESCKEAFEKAKHDYDIAEQDLLDHLEGLEATATAKYEDLGYAMIPKPRLYASCNAENQESLFEFLKEQGREDLIKVSVNAQSLSSFTKEQIEEGGYIPEFINYYLKSSIRLY